MLSCVWILEENGVWDLCVKRSMGIMCKTEYGNYV